MARRSLRPKPNSSDPPSANQGDALPIASPNRASVQAWNLSVDPQQTEADEAQAHPGDHRIGRIEYPEDLLRVGEDEDVQTSADGTSYSIRNRTAPLRY
jgi:hypothetical protein